MAREVREWIELRDEVLDEVARHAFDFAAARAACLAAAPGSPERAEQARRAGVAAAGISAWAGVPAQP